jgi:hypothetical protein
MTTPRQNMLDVLNHKTPEWMPLAGHCDPYNQPSREGMDPELAAALGEVQWGDMSTVTFSKYLGLDIFDWYDARKGVKVSRRKVSMEESVDGDTTTRIWHTPKGDLREVSRICRDPSGAVSMNYTEHLVETPAELEALASIFEDEVIEVDPEGMAATAERKRIIGDQGLLGGPFDGTPLGMMYRIYSGVANLAYLWADAPDTMRDCFRVIEENYLAQLRIAVQSDIDVIVGVDDTSTTAISPEMFEMYNMDLTDTRADVAHAAGKFYFHHSCGLIKDLLPLYRRTKMDAVHAFTVPPVGNVTITEGREVLGDRITIYTGIGNFESLEDRGAVRRYIHSLINEGRPWDHFIFQVAAFPNRTMEEIQFLVDCCREIGGGA